VLFNEVTDHERGRPPSSGLAMNIDLDAIQSMLCNTRRQSLTFASVGFTSWTQNHQQEVQSPEVQNAEDTVGSAVPKILPDRVCAIETTRRCLPKKVCAKETTRQGVRHNIPEMKSTPRCRSGTGGA
jgi:hypothetical protein